VKAKFRWCLALADEKTGETC